MRLLRVSVPNFRVLKDVDLRFEKDFTPQIFPLGSLNGGGKSTLLQLIFILCRTDVVVYAENILDYVTPNTNESIEIATLEIWDDERKQSVTLTFCCADWERWRRESVQVRLDIVPISQFDSTGKNKGRISGLYYQVKGIVPKVSHSEFSKDFLEFTGKLRSRVFLAAPASQPFLFLPSAERKSLFKVGGSYDQFLEKAKKTLPGFFTYDTFSVATISSFFRTAWDKDTEAVVKTGKYGDNYAQMLHDINQVIAGKTIIPQLVNTAQGSRPLEKDLIDSIMFKSAEGTEIYPEDLSHGELKKLSIYAWLKANQIKNSIVLMDEIENGFHPDWQFEIVRELEKWEPSNQYILATHSYSLCTALTPAHVKELEPKLIAN